MIGYAPTVISFFLLNVINNQALNYHVPVPLHIIFRSGSLMASLVLNILLLSKKYSWKKYFSVTLITIGIIICTMATSSLQKLKGGTATESNQYYSEWIIGITMLTSALFGSAYLAICQERMYQTYGKHPREAMFVIHGASLPFFAFLGSDIMKYVKVFNRSSPYIILGISVPHMWLFLFASSVLQWMCILFVYRLNAEVDSLTVTLVVTLRKFLSLIISIVWFRNTFTLIHWFGAILVFSGTLIFAELWHVPTDAEKKAQ
ncbi:hypothetical protein AB6A40_010414 [Gnathostoma spinigerum]|uniref:UDP-xylose and UDP-N-acetylglucosamine transporter n=1 Tax=Gnathostoma spinigerum TaxID=75299 RepID=A0ABD6EUQ9_9BILA